MKRRAFLAIVVATPIAAAISRIIDLDKLPPLPKPPVHTGQIGHYHNVRFIESARRPSDAAYVAMRDRYFRTRIGMPAQRYLPTPTRAEKLAAQEEFYAVMSDAEDTDPHNWIMSLPEYKG